MADRRFETAPLSSLAQRSDIAARAAAARQRPSEKHMGRAVPFYIKVTATTPSTVSVKLPKRYANVRVEFHEPDPANSVAEWSEISADGSAANIGGAGPCAQFDPAQFQDSAKSLLLKDTEYVYYNVTLSGTTPVLWIICHLSGSTEGETDSASPTIIV